MAFILFSKQTVFCFPKPYRFCSPCSFFSLKCYFPNFKCSDPSFLSKLSEKKKKKTFFSKKPLPVCPNLNYFLSLNKFHILSSLLITDFMPYFIGVYVYIYIYMCVCVCVCVCGLIFQFEDKILFYSHSLTQ